MGRSLLLIRTSEGAPSAPLTGVLYGCLSAGALLATRSTGGVAVIWPSGAIPLAALLLRTESRWLPVLGACGAGGLITNLLVGNNLLVALAFTTCNLLDGLIAALALRRWRVAEEPDGSLISIAKFSLVTGVAVPAVSAAFATPIVVHTFGDTSRQAFRAWFAGDALGYLLLTPPLFLCWQALLRRSRASAFRAAKRSLLECCAIQMIVLVVTCVAVRQSVLPLLFLPVLPLMVATLRMGRTGVLIAMLLIAAAAVSLTLHGDGLIVASLPDLAGRLHFLQFYLVVLLATALPTAAILEERDTLIEQTAASELRHRLLTETSSDAIVQIDRQGVCIHASASFERLLGVSPEQIVGRSVADYVHPTDIQRVWQEHAALAQDCDRAGVIVYRARHTSGQYRWLETNARALCDAGGEPYGFVCVVRDITARKRAEAELQEQVATDALTGALSRRRFMARLEERLATPPDTDGVLSVAMIDADHFKQVNDRYGHAVGDKALVEIVKACQAVLRANDEIGRLGGEEFGVILATPTIEIAHTVCDRIRSAVDELRIANNSGVDLRITISAGLAIAKLDDDAASLLARADGALYLAKASGRNALERAA